MPDGRKVLRRHHVLGRDFFKQTQDVELIHRVTFPDGREERLAQRFTMRYQTYVLRLLNPSQVFSSMVSGFKAAAMDVRGYGDSSRPHPIAAYTMKELTSDVAAVIDARRRHESHIPTPFAQCRLPLRLPTWPRASLGALPSTSTPNRQTKNHRPQDPRARPPCAGQPRAQHPTKESGCCLDNVRHQHRHGRVHRSRRRLVSRNVPAMFATKASPRR